MGIKQKFLDSLVEDWKNAWKWFSVQSTLIITFIATFAVTEKETFDSIVSVLPEEVRKVLVPLIGLFMVYARLKDQSKGKTTGQ
jgi:uncharacterized membrane protein